MFSFSFPEKLLVSVDVLGSVLLFLLVDWLWIGRWHCSSSAVFWYFIAIIHLCEISLFRIQSRDNLLKSSEIMKAIVQSLLHLSAIFLLDNVWLLGEMICGIDTECCFQNCARPISQDKY